MKRRELIKGLAACATLALMPNLSVFGSGIPNLHFIGLGFAGRNVILNIYKKRIDGKYTYMCYRQHPEMTSDINFIYYEYPRHFRQPNELGKQPISLLPEMMKILSDDRIYIVVVGLGAYSGTSLISDTLKYLESNNKRYLAICTLPFKNEGRSRNNYAREKMIDLQKYKNVRFFDNNEIQVKYGISQISKSFAKADEKIYSVFENELPSLIS